MYHTELCVLCTCRDIRCRYFIGSNAQRPTEKEKGWPCETTRNAGKLICLYTKQYIRKLNLRRVLKNTCDLFWSTHQYDDDDDDERLTSSDPLQNQLVQPGVY